MPTMTPTTHLEVIEAVEHMPIASRLVVHDFSWDEYEHLMEKFTNRRNPRFSYDCGRLEVVSPGPLHDRYEALIVRLVTEFCEAHDLLCEPYGHTTWKREDLFKGVEADGSFFISNARCVIGKKEFNLEVDPPPDLALEIDATRDSRRKFEIYAAMGVPEVWRFDGERLCFYELREGRYSEISISHCLKGLTPDLLEGALQVAPSKGYLEAVKAFRRSVKKLKK
jgi:Uma2 family endonuclease